MFGRKEAEVASRQRKSRNRQFYYLCYPFKWGGAGSVVVITTGYGLDGLGIESRWGAKFSAPVQTGPGAHPPSCTTDTGSFPGVKSGRGVTLTLHPLLVPWWRKGRAKPLLPLWAVRPVQSLSACTRVTFTFTFTFKWDIPLWRVEHNGEINQSQLLSYILLCVILLYEMPETWCNIA